MDTKLKADIAEAAVTTKLLKEGFRVLKPVGDRLPYDLGIDINGRLLKIQIKSAWYRNNIYTVDSRRTKTNRRQMLRTRYDKNDFDFAILYIEDHEVFYVMPIEEFSSYKSGITLVEQKKRQRKPRSYRYREAWDLLKSWATQPVTAENKPLSNSVKLEMVIPSQAPMKIGEGVETRRQAPDTVSSVG